MTHEAEKEGKARISGNAAVAGREISALERRLAAGKGYWELVVFLVSMSALGSFVNDMYTPALPEICDFYGCSVPVGQLGLTMGMIGLGLGQIILGPVSDHYGRKPVMVWALMVYVIFTGISIFSPSIHIFNLSRLMQGAGASAGYFLARTIPADVYGGRQLAKLMAIVGAINGIAPASAPVLGGFVAQLTGWKGVFITLSALGLILLCFSPMLRESLAVGKRTKGNILKSFGGYKELLANRAFMTHVCLKGVSLGLLFAYMSGAPFIIERHYGLSELHYGLVIGVNAIFVAAGSMLALKFHPFKKSAVMGCVITALGVVAQSIALWHVNSLWVYEVCIVVMLFGLGLIFSSTNTLAMNEGRTRAGEASSVLGVSGYVVGAAVSPLVGLGNILHSTAIVFLVLAALILILGNATRRTAPDLGA